MMDEKLKSILPHIAIVGAGGKMGRGVAYLVLKAVIQWNRKYFGFSKPIHVKLIDVNEEALLQCESYLQHLFEKNYEKENEAWRSLYPGEGDRYADYIEDVKQVAKYCTDLNAIRGSKLIFEVVPEIPSLKLDLFKKMNVLIEKESCIFTNTSSIPIHILEEESGLLGNVLGFHFYNPPPVQPLLELIQTKHTEERNLKLAEAVIDLLGKEKILSGDVAGFIGNGMFIREALEHIHIAEKIQKEIGNSESIYAVNLIAESALLRPMGMFQLIDYVGIDVFDSIIKVMDQYIPDESLSSVLSSKLLNAGIKGGQDAKGLQKDGFFKYEKRKITAVYDVGISKYKEVNDSFKDNAGKYLGKIEKEELSWKSLLKVKDREIQIQNHFNDLKKSKTKGAGLAIELLKIADQIGRNLVKNKVANKEEDVNSVMVKGFHHLYGPIHLNGF